MSEKKAWDTDLKRRQALYKKDYSEWSDEDLLWMLEEQHKPIEIPACRVCGEELSIGRSGGGEPTLYSCSPYEDDPDNPDKLKMKEGRSLADDHGRDSRFEDRRHADGKIIELITRFKLLKDGEAV